MSWNLFDLEVKRRVAHRHRVLPRVAAYREQLLKDINPFTAQPYSKSSVMQHLATIRRLHDWLNVGQVLPYNPAAAVRARSQARRQARQDSDPR